MNGTHITLQKQVDPEGKRYRLMISGLTDQPDGSGALEEVIMSNWTEAELAKIATADDLHVSPFREDGVTYGTPTWIWSVVVDGSFYVRAYNGQNSRWYKAAMAQKGGRVSVSGIEKDVIFEPVEGTINEAINAAYRVKYASSPYLAPMIGNRARTATVKITPL